MTETWQQAAKRCGWWLLKRSASFPSQMVADERLCAFKDGFEAGKAQRPEVEPTGVGAAYEQAIRESVGSILSKHAAELILNRAVAILLAPSPRGTLVEGDLREQRKLHDENGRQS